MSFTTTRELIIYKGELDFTSIGEILSLYGHEVRSLELELVVNKRVYGVLVESLENAHRHSFSYSNTMKHKPVELVIRNNDKELIVEVGNYVANSEIEGLSKRINSINELDDKGLSRQYRSSILSATISSKGGAGLGLLEIAKHSRQKIKFEFEPESMEFSFFKMIIIVSKNPNKIN